MSLLNLKSEKLNNFALDNNEKNVNGFIVFHRTVILPYFCVYALLIQISVFCFIPERLQSDGDML